MPTEVAFPLLIPTPGKVYLRRLQSSASVSPYVIPDAAKEKSVECEVLAVPRNIYFEYGVEVSCPVRVGEKVLVGKYAGDYEFRGEKITIVRWEEILAIIPEVGVADNYVATGIEGLNLPKKGPQR